MQSFRAVIDDYKKSRKGIGHFNFSDSNQLKAIALSSIETKLPVSVGLSEGERDYFPIAHARALCDIYNHAGAALYLNADHTYSVEKAQKAIADGVDSIVVDGAQLSFEKNVELLKQAVAYARASGRDVMVEGELGYIGTGSNVMDSLPEGAAITEEMMTKPDELKKLVEVSGIDLVAPAVGNIHGVVKSGQPKLSIGRIATLAGSAGVPLVLHGGSGSSDEEFAASVAAGIVMIHINTDLRVLYRDTLKETLLGNTNETTPYKFIGPSVVKMKEYTIQKMRLFAGQK